MPVSGGQGVGDLPERAILPYDCLLLPPGNPPGNLAEQQGGCTMPIVKSWLPLTRAETNKVPERGGVYELADNSQNIIYIGKAEAGQLRKQLSGHTMDRNNPVIKAKAKFFRFSATANAGSEYKALLESFKKAHGNRLPEANQAEMGEAPPAFE